jgi:hypothetical protein
MIKLPSLICQAFYAQGSSDHSIFQHVFAKPLPNPLFRSNLPTKENKPLKDILTEIRSNLEEQAKIHDEISGPFSCAIVDRDGFKKIE